MIKQQFKNGLSCFSHQKYPQEQMIFISEIQSPFNRPSFKKAPKLFKEILLEPLVRFFSQPEIPKTATSFEIHRQPH